MGDEAPPPTNGGIVRWDRLNAELRVRDNQLRDDFRREGEALREEIKANTARARSVASRVDALESIRDEQRGAWRLALWLIGGNLVATVVLVLAFIAPAIARAT